MFLKLLLYLLRFTTIQAVQTTELTAALVRHSCLHTRLKLMTFAVFFIY